MLGLLEVILNLFLCDFHKCSLHLTKVHITEKTEFNT